MIDSQVIRTLANRYQTSSDNILREYFQHLFLSYLYQEKAADSLLFKGGTALRIVWQSPRFSEDLDFTGVATSPRAIESILEKTLIAIEREGIEVKIDEAKKTSGGYFSLLQFEGGGNRGEIQLEISLRGGGKPRGNTVLISSEFLPPLTLINLEEKTVVQEKVNAVLSRAKPRDFFDLYFILRSRLGFNSVFQRDKTLRDKLLRAIGKIKFDLSGDLKRFLPLSHQGLLKNFKAILTSEIERSLPNK